MKRIYRSIAVALFSLTMILGLRVPDASALKCVEPPRPLAAEIEYSKLAFKGKLIAESSDVLTFKVSTWWKGDSSQSTVKLHQNFWTEFEKGEEYFVFAGDRDGSMRPNLCGNTGPIENVDTKPLGPGTRVVTPLERSNIATQATVLGSIIVTALSAICVVRRFM